MICFCSEMMCFLSGNDMCMLGNDMFLFGNAMCLFVSDMFLFGNDMLLVENDWFVYGDGMFLLGNDMSDCIRSDCGRFVFLLIRSLSIRLRSVRSLSDRRRQFVMLLTPFGFVFIIHCLSPRGLVGYGDESY